MNKTFLLTFVQGPNYQTDKGFHDQPFWENHSRFADKLFLQGKITTVSYTHLRAHETVLDLVCRLLLEKKKKTNSNSRLRTSTRHR